MKSFYRNMRRRVKYLLRLIFLVLILSLLVLVLVAGSLTVVCLQLELLLRAESTTEASIDAVLLVGVSGAASVQDALCQRVLSGFLSL